MERVVRSVNRERGQASVEFALFSFMLFLAMMLMIQLMWVGIQKWQFEHYASYAARVWTVNKGGDSAETSLIKVQGASLLRWNLMSSDYVKLMWVSDDNATDDDGNKGLKYTGIAPVMSLFKPFIGDTLTGVTIPGVARSIFPGLSIPSTGLIRFETFIPMEKEPDEDPNRYDNDCSDGCNDNER